MYYYDFIVIYHQESLLEWASTAENIYTKHIRLSSFLYPDKSTRYSGNPQLAHKAFLQGLVVQS